MAEIKKKWADIVFMLNTSSQIAQQCTNSLKAMENLEKENKGKAELKKEIEQNQKNKPKLEEQLRVYTEIVKHFKAVGDEHNDKLQEINIDHALETEVSPAKDGKPAVKKLVLDEKGNYCYDREAEKSKGKAIREFQQTETFVKQLNIATTLTDDEKPEFLQGFVIFEKAKTKPPLRPVTKKA